MSHLTIGIFCKINEFLDLISLTQFCKTCHASRQSVKIYFQQQASISNTLFVHAYFEVLKPLWWPRNTFFPSTFVGGENDNICEYFPRTRDPSASESILRQVSLCEAPSLLNLTVLTSIDKSKLNRKLQSRARISQRSKIDDDGGGRNNTNTTMQTGLTLEQHFVDIVFERLAAMMVWLFKRSSKCLSFMPGSHMPEGWFLPLESIIDLSNNCKFLRYLDFSGCRLIGHTDKHVQVLPLKEDKRWMEPFIGALSELANLCEINLTYCPALNSSLLFYAMQKKMPKINVIRIPRQHSGEHVCEGHPGSSEAFFAVGDRHLYSLNGNFVFHKKDTSSHKGIAHRIVRCEHDFDGEFIVGSSKQNNLYRDELFQVLKLTNCNLDAPYCGERGTAVGKSSDGDPSIVFSQNIHQCRQNILKKQIHEKISQATSKLKTRFSGEAISSDPSTPNSQDETLDPTATQKNSSPTNISIENFEMCKSYFLHLRFPKLFRVPNRNYVLHLMFDEFSSHAVEVRVRHSKDAKACAFRTWHSLTAMRAPTIFPASFQDGVQPGDWRITEIDRPRFMDDPQMQPFIDLDDFYNF